MAQPVEKVIGDQAEEKWQSAMGTDVYSAIDNYFRSGKGYDLAGSNVLMLGPESENDYMVAFTFDDGREDTILEAVLTFRDDEVVDTKITRDFISDDEITRTEIFDIQDGEVVKRKEVE